jgi:hypothetical protein
MKKVSGIVGGLKFILKYAVYITALIKIVQFAIATIDEIKDQEEPKEPAKIVEHE